MKIYKVYSFAKLEDVLICEDRWCNCIPKVYGIYLAHIIYKLSISRNTYGCFVGTGRLIYIHYTDVIMSTMTSQITSLTTVYSTVYSRRGSKKTSKLCVTGLSEGNSPVTGEFPAHRASNAENVLIWWRHHACPNVSKAIIKKFSKLINNVWYTTSKQSMIKSCILCTGAHEPPQHEIVFRITELTY